MSEHEPHTTRAEKEVDALLLLRRRRPVLFWTFLGILAIAIAVIAFDKFYGIPKLQKENATIRSQLTEKTAEIQRLETQLAPFRTLALQRYPGSEQEALLALSKEVDRLSSQLEIAQKTITDLKLEIALTFTGDWSGKKLSSDLRQVLPSKNAYVYLHHSSGDPSKDIVFYPTDVRTAKRTNDRVGIEYSATVRPARFPLGKTTDHLVDYTYCEFAVPFLDKNTTKDGTAVLEVFEMRIFVSGVQEYLFSDKPYAVVNLQEPGFATLVSMRDANVFRIQH